MLSRAQNMTVFPFFLSPSLQEVNCRTAVSKGFIAGLLKLFADWHSNDPDRENLPIQKALLHCLHRASNTSLGRSALVAGGGIALLFQTTQVHFCS